MKKVIVTIVGVVMAVSLFGAGIMASTWLSFTGDDEITESEGHVDKILEILEKVHQGKEVAEEELDTALKNLQQLQEDYDKMADLNPPGLVNQIKELKNDLAIANNRINELEDLLLTEKNKNAVLTTDLASKNKEINEKNELIDSLKSERDGLKAERDKLSAENVNLQKIIDDFNDNSDYIEHLEKELERANEKVVNLNSHTNGALEKAKGYLEEDGTTEE